MTLIAVEEHVLPADLVDQVWPTRMAPEGLTAKLADVDELRKPSDELEAPFGTVVELIREAFTAGSVSAATYDAAVALLGVPHLIDLMSLAGMDASTAALLNVFDMQLDPGETHLLPSLD